MTTPCGLLTGLAMTISLAALAALGTTRAATEARPSTQAALAQAALNPEQP
jgi:hypothetical protein